MKSWQKRMLQVVWIVLLVAGVVGMLPLLGSMAGVITNVIMRNKGVAFLMGLVLAVLGAMVYVGSRKFEKDGEELAYEEEWTKEYNPEEGEFEETEELEPEESDSENQNTEENKSEKVERAEGNSGTNTSSDVKTIETDPKEQAKNPVVNESVGVHTATPKGKVGGWPEY
jgi:hypothetical protein